MNPDQATDVPADFCRTAPRSARHRLFRWAVGRLIVVWTPIAVVLSLALADALYSRLDLSDLRYRSDIETIADMVPSQALFALLLVAAGRFEVGPRDGSEASAKTTHAYWAVSVVLITLWCAGLFYLAVHRPVPQ